MVTTGPTHILCLAFALLSVAATAQLPNYQLHRVQEEGGLKTADVVGMARGRHGFLWIATQSEVQQFDGRHTLHYPFAETITKLLIDSRNRKWVLTRTSLFLFDDTLRRFGPVGYAKTGKLNVSDLLLWTDGSVRALVNGRLYRFVDDFYLFAPSVATALDFLKPTRCFGNKGAVYFFEKKDSLIYYNTATNGHSAVALGNVVATVPVNTHEAIAATYQHKTFRIDFNRKTVEPLPLNDATGNNFAVTDGVQLNEKRFLLATTRGLLHYNASEKTLQASAFYTAGRPFDNAASTSVLYKDEGGTVFMNNADGLYFLEPAGGFIHYLRNHSGGGGQLPANDVRNFTEDAEGNIWMATTAGIASLALQTGSLQNFDPASKGGVAYPSYRQVLDVGNQLWVGTSGAGAWVYNKQNGTTGKPWFTSDEAGRKAAALFAKTYTWKLLRLASDSLLVVGGSAVFLVDRSSLKTRQVPLQFAGAVSRSAVQDGAGRIWHGTTRGLTCYNAAFQPLFSLLDSLPDKRVASLCELAPNKMLIGSKGLFELTLKGNRIAAFRQMKGLPSERLVYCMVQDRQGLVWMGTDEGLYRYDPVSERAVYFDASDGVQSQAFNSDGAFISSKGIVFMGGKNGVNYFTPASYQPTVQKLQPLLLSFTAAVADSVLEFPQRLPYSSRDIDFIISAPEFKKPFRIQYRYRLRATDNWTGTGFNNRVRISNLPPGDYRLQVSASFDGRGWFDGAEATPFSVLKPWWETTWFRLLCVAAIAFAFWQWKRYQRKKTEAKELKRIIDYLRHSTSAQASVDLVLWDIAGNCISRLGFEDCVIYLLNEQRAVLVQKAAYGAKSPAPFLIADPIEIPVGQGITGWVAQTAETLLVNDTSKDGRYIVDDERRLSELAVPIIHQGRLIGVIDSEHHKKAFFTPHHQKTLETIASLCASRIATALALEATQKAEAELRLLNGKMMESKFANLRLQMNPHFLFNILTTIQYLIVSSQVEKATHYVDVFSGFLRSLLNHAEDSMVTLEEELRILGLYVELESLILDETFVWEVQVADDIDAEDVQMPFMLFQPFIENAIHHGLMHKVGEKRFTITIGEADEESLTCTIQDNGVGRTASAGINGKNLSRVLHQSKGLGIVEERLHLLQQKTGKKAFFKIVDLWDGETATGTAVYLLMPYYTTEEV